ncbi:MAG: sigma-70 family RNA polymerase sigma factor [Caulobacteraceae bacterium]|nr:sigma-70 family RNA polymerase sigma factor [Caulobacteraceae bacterium]
MRTARPGAERRTTGVSEEARLKALMLRGLAGEAGAHSQMLASMSGYLRGYFGKRLPPGAADLEDLVQETLLAIHLKRDTYDKSQPFTPWAYMLARYKLLDHYRRTGARRSAPIEDAGELLATENPEEGAVRRDLGRLLASLPPRQARLLRDVKIEGFSMEEAAARSGMSVAAVKVSVHRGLKALARKARDEDR